MIADTGMLKLGKDMIEKFIERFEDFVSSVKLEDAIENGLSVDDPMISYAALKDEKMEGFLIQCCPIFTDEELERLRIFIDGNSNYRDVMNVQVIRPFQLTLSK
jgi:hypothetical protein